jgi:hypothetical protein
VILPTLVNNQILIPKFPIRSVTELGGSSSDSEIILGLLEEAVAINIDILKRLAKRPGNVALRRELREFQELAYRLVRDYELALERHLTRLMMSDS